MGRKATTYLIAFVNDDGQVELEPFQSLESIGESLATWKADTRATAVLIRGGEQVPFKFDLKPTIELVGAAERKPRKPRAAKPKPEPVANGKTDAKPAERA